MRRFREVVTAAGEPALNGESWDVLKRNVPRSKLCSKLSKALVCLTWAFVSLPWCLPALQSGGLRGEKVSGCPTRSCHGLEAAAVQSLACCSAATLKTGLSHFQYFICAAGETCEL